MGLSNARYYERGRFFWDERAATLEDQVLMPIQDSVEMGMTLPQLEAKLAATDFYPALFADAFGTSDINRDRISQALAQFVRSMVSYQSKYDEGFDAGRNGRPNFEAVFTDPRISRFSALCRRAAGRKQLRSLRPMPSHQRRRQQQCA